MRYQGSEAGIRQFLDISTDAVAHRNRQAAEISSLVDELERIDPGFVGVTQWRPDPAQVSTPQPLDAYGGMTREV